MGTAGCRDEKYRGHVKADLMAKVGTRRVRVRMGEMRVRSAVASQFAVSALWEGGKEMRRIQASCGWGMAVGFNKKSEAALARGGRGWIFRGVVEV